MAGAPIWFDSRYAHMSVKRQSKNKLNSFEEVRVFQNDSLLAYSGDLQQSVIVRNDEKDTLYIIEGEECSCKGFQFRGECKHIDGLEQVEVFLRGEL